MQRLLTFSLKTVKLILLAVISLFLLLIAIIYIAGSWDEWFPECPAPKPGFYSGFAPRPMPTTSAYLIDLEVAQVKFRIPANYIWDPAARCGGKQDLISMFALMPRYDPYSTTNKKSFNQAIDSTIGYQDVLVFRINASSPLQEKEFWHSLLRADGPPREGPHGLSMFLDRRSENKRFWSALFLRPNKLNEEKISILSCELTEYTAFPTCKGNSVVETEYGRFSLEYKFDYKYLVDWAEIEATLIKRVIAFHNAALQK